MSHFLWIEDFENSAKTTASNLFKSIINEQDFSDNTRQLRHNLERYGIFIELSFQDGLIFIQNKLDNIDYIILDIDLPAYSKADTINKGTLQFLERFHTYKASNDERDLKTKCEELKKIAGYYLYTELVIELGFPKDKILFCSNHGENLNSIKEAFKKAKVILPPIYEKSDPDAHDWITKNHENNYSRLRRGIIEGCRFLKSHIEKDETNIQFRDFIKRDKKKQPIIEIVSTDVINYLDTLSQFLPLKQTNEQQTSVQYRLFLRTMAHEWEENIDPEAIKNIGYDYKNIHDIHTFAWLSKMTRNWTAHANLLEPLNPQILAFLFLVNMRAMFKLPKEVQSYEKRLFSCLPEVTSCNVSPEDIKLLEKNINEIMVALKTPDYNENQNFGEKINSIYRQNTGNPDAEQHNFQNFLLQYFWVNQSKYLHRLNSQSGDFLPVLARHIYKSSFPKV